MEKLTSLACGHWFCPHCWNSYLRVQITEGKGEVRAASLSAQSPGEPDRSALDCLPCLQVQGDNRRDDRRLVGRPRAVPQVLRVRAEELRAAQQGPHLVPPPRLRERRAEQGRGFHGPLRLQRALLLHLPAGVPLVRSYCCCRLSSRSGCADGRVRRRPASCEAFKWWLEKYEQRKRQAEEDRASLEWLLSHSKDCPACASPIEKCVCTYPPPLLVLIGAVGTKVATT